jgi:hypothetical protein
MADFRLGRIKFKWQGAWTSSTDYVKDDVVRNNGNSYVAILNHTSTGSFATDLAANKWDLMVSGDGSPTDTEGDMIYREGSSDTRLPIGNDGQVLMVTSGLPHWEDLTTAQNVYYVSQDGDDANDGTNLNLAFATIKHACETVTGPAVIFVKTGTYYEQLPIKVPAGVSVYGDGQRTTQVRPIDISVTGATVTATIGAATSTTIVVQNALTTGSEWQVGARVTGTSITGTVAITNIALNTPTTGFTTLTVSCTSQVISAQTVTLASDYSEGTMWMLGDGSMLHKMYFGGMTGFQPNLSFPEDIEQATIKGVYIALDPDSPILNKSPYVLECACFSDGGIGAIVDGDLHNTGYKSMVFHAYTVINSDGVGYWIAGQGKAEIVSCFTYYCWFGYATTGGGKLRSLSGNNSYGTYGVVSRGFDAEETPLTGALYGEQITYDELSLTGGEFSVGDTITGSVSGATGEITNVQTAVGKIYYSSTSGTFLDTDTISTGGGSPVTADIATGGVAGQKGFVLVADGFNALPRPGASLQIAGDASSYIIQSVSGSWTNITSILVLVLANEKANPSLNNAAVTIRYNYSQSRLTGHDFLSIGTGGRTDTNYPDAPLQAASQANEVIESFPGRVFYVSTDQDGNFRVGDYFRVDQATGRATLNASAFDLSGLTSLRLGSIGAQLGELVNEFSSDYTLSGDSNEAVPTEAAVRGYFEVVATDIVPVDDNTLTLGTPSKRWNHVYVGPGSITLGSLTITDDVGTLSVTGTGTTPASINISEVDTGSIRYFQNNIIGTNSNENIIITPSGSGGVLVDGISVFGTTIDSNDSSGITFTPAVTINSDLTVENDLRVTHALTVGSDVTISGNLVINGTQTTINTVDLNIADSIIYMGDDNPADTVDIGFVSSFTNGGYQHTGLIRDATDGVWKLFKGVTDEPTTVVNFTSATYSDLLINKLTTTGNIDVAATSKITINGSAGTNGKFLQTTSSGMEWADAAVTVSDSSTNSTFYPLFTTATSGTVTSASVSSSKFSFNPSTGAFAVKGSIAIQGSSSGAVTFTVPATAGSVTYTLPTADAAASGYALVSNGSGTLSWAAAGATINNSSSSSTFYPTFAASTSGSFTTAHISSSGLTFTPSTGTLTVTALTESSSITLKENINPLTNALDSILQLCGVSYDRRDGSRKDEVGLIAEDVNKVIPNLVSKDENGNPLGIQYTKLTAYLVEAIKSLKAEIDELKGNK